jgi:hypothetical protein
MVEYPYEKLHSSCGSGAHDKSLSIENVINN